MFISQKTLLYHLSSINAKIIKMIQISKETIKVS